MRRAWTVVSPHGVRRRTGRPPNLPPAAAHSVGLTEFRSHKLSHKRASLCWRASRPRACAVICGSPALCDLHRPCADADLVPLILGHYLEKSRRRRSTSTDVLAVSSLWRASAAAAVADANTRGLAWVVRRQRACVELYTLQLSNTDALRVASIYQSSSHGRLLWSGGSLVPGQPRPHTCLIECEEMMMMLNHASGYVTGSTIDAFIELRHHGARSAEVLERGFNRVTCGSNI